MATEEAELPGCPSDEGIKVLLQIQKIPVGSRVSLGDKPGNKTRKILKACRKSGNKTETFHITMIRTLIVNDCVLALNKELCSLSENNSPVRNLQILAALVIFHHVDNRKFRNSFGISRKATSSSTRLLLTKNGIVTFRMKIPMSYYNQVDTLWPGYKSLDDFRFDISGTDMEEEEQEDGGLLSDEDHPEEESRAMSPINISEWCSITYLVPFLRICYNVVMK